MLPISASIFGPPYYQFWLVLLWIGYSVLGYVVMLRGPEKAAQKKEVEQNHLADSKDGQE